MVNAHYWCTRTRGKNDSCVDSKRLIVKVAASKGCRDRWDAVIGWIGVVSHHLWSLLGAIERTILCAFVCRVGYFDAQLGKL